MNTTIRTKNWFWDPLELELTEDVVWDSGKRGVNFRSPDSKLVIADGVWTIAKGFKWNGTTGVPDGPTIEDPTGVPVKSSSGKIPITWLASLIHDTGYAYLYCRTIWCTNGIYFGYTFPYTRKEIDGYLRDNLKAVGFEYSNLYWWGVRLLGGFVITYRIIFGEEKNG